MKSIEQLDLNSELDQAGSREDALKKKTPKAEGTDMDTASATTPEISTIKKEPTKEDLYWRKVFPETNDQQHNDAAQEWKDKIINNIAKPSEQNQKLPENRIIRGKKNKWKDQPDYKSRQFKDND
jgi:hypothetical protein